VGHDQDAVLQAGGVQANAPIATAASRPMTAQRVSLRRVRMMGAAGE